MIRLIKLQVSFLNYLLFEIFRVRTFPKFSFPIWRMFTSLYMLVFLNGLLITSLFYTYIEAQYDANIFGGIVAKINQDTDARINNDTFLMRSMRLANAIQHNGSTVFGNLNMTDIKGQFLRNSLDDLLTGRGCCGSASSILLRVLEINNYEVRFAQMKVGDTPGGHIVIEARKGGDWMVIDPLFNCYFKKPNGQFASFYDVQNNWTHYQKQLPSGYPNEYRFEDVRYTNWNKIPVVGTMIKKMLDLTMGKHKADQISVRIYLIKNYQVMFVIIQILFIPLSILTLKKFRSRFSASNVLSRMAT